MVGIPTIYGDFPGEWFMTLLYLRASRERTFHRFFFERSSHASHAADRLAKFQIPAAFLATATLAQIFHPPDEIAGIRWGTKTNMWIVTFVPEMPVFFV